MNILITGAAGFLGRRLVAQLMAEAQHTLVGIDRNPLPDQAGFRSYYQGDLSNQALNQVREPIEVIIHLAADVDRCSDAQCVVDNLYVLHLLGEWARNGHVKKIIYPSTTGIYDAEKTVGVVSEGAVIGPRSLYGITKYLAEQYLRVCGLDFTILRFPYLFGIGDSKGTLADIIRAILNGGVPSVREESRDYLDVGDATRAVATAIQYEGSYKEFNCGTGKLISMEEIAAVVGRLSGISVKGVNVKGARQNVAVDSSLAAKELGWHPSRTFEQTLEEEIAFLRKALHEGRE